MHMCEGVRGRGKRRWFLKSKSYTDMWLSKEGQTHKIQSICVCIDVYLVAYMKTFLYFTKMYPCMLPSVRIWGIVCICIDVCVTAWMNIHEQVGLPVCMRTCVRENISASPHAQIIDRCVSICIHPKVWVGRSICINFCTLVYQFVSTFSRACVLSECLEVPVCHWEVKGVGTVGVVNFRMKNSKRNTFPILSFLFFFIWDFCVFFLCWEHVHMEESVCVDTHTSITRNKQTFITRIWHRLIKKKNSEVGGWEKNLIWPYWKLERWKEKTKESTEKGWRIKRWEEERERERKEIESEKEKWVKSQN